MAQHDYVIANGTGAAVRSDLNNALAAIVSNNSGATEPATMYAYQWWADTTTGLLKLRNAANNAWISLRELDGTLTIEDGTASSPGLAFADDLNTGIYSPSADQLGITTGGTVRLTTTTTGITSALPVDVPLGTASAPTVTFTGDLNTGIYSPGADQVAISTNGSQRVTVNSSGFLGVGTGSPSVAVHVSGASNNAAQLRSTNTTSNVDTVLVSETTGVLRTNTNHSLSLGTNLTTAITIDTSQRVGIGTTAPSGDFVISKAGAEGVEFYPGLSSNNNIVLHYNRSGSVHAVAENRAAQHVFAIGAAEKARIDTSGRLLIGTSTARNFATHDAKIQLEGVGYNNSTLQVVGNSNDSAGAYIFIGKSRGTTLGSSTVVQSGDEIGCLDFFGTDGTNAVRAARIGCNVDGTPGTNDMPGRLVFSTTPDSGSSPVERMRIGQNGQHNIFSSDNGLVTRVSSGAGVTVAIHYGTYSATNNTNGTICYVVWSNGNVQNTNNSYGAYSDARLKENVVDANSQWDDIKAMRVRKYNFKEGQTHTQIGLVAQEVELVSPGLVSESPDRDEDGNDLGTVTKSVNYSVLYMKAVKALQEAMERIEQLESEMAAVKAQLS